MNPIDPGYDLYPGLAEETELSRRDLYAIGASIAMLASSMAACSPGHGAEPDSSAPPSVVATRAATPAPDTSASPTATPDATTPAEATTVKDGQTSDGRAYASLKPGDTVASTDYVGALRAGIKMYRFDDGSAAVIDPSGTLPDAVVSDVSSGVGDGLGWRESRWDDVVGHLRTSGVIAYVVRPFYTETDEIMWILDATDPAITTPDLTGVTVRSTVEEAVAASQADIDAHPDVIIIGPDGIIPRG